MMNKSKTKWKEFELGDVLKYEQPQKYIVESTNYDDSYNTPVLTAGKSFIIGYTNETEGICNNLPVIIFDDFTTSSQYVDFPFKVKSSAMKILHPTKEANIKFLYYIMQTIQYNAKTHKRYWISEYSKIKINLPPKEIQDKIVEILEDHLEKVETAENILNENLNKIKNLKNLLQRNASEVKAGAGQYFTPRALIKAMVEVMKPTPDTKIIDPACGTGGFLLAAYDYMKRRTNDKIKLKKLREECLYGNDNTSLVVSLCSMNMYLHGIGGKESPIRHCDSLMSAGDVRYDMVLANPPFGKKSAEKIMAEDGSLTTEQENYYREDFFATTSNKQLNFLQHIMTILKTNGRAAVVLPDNVLSEGYAGEKIRKKLLKQYNLHTILRLPTGIFYKPGVTANVLFFDKFPPLENGHRTNDVWIYDLRTNMHFTLVTNPMKYDDLKDFIECYSAGDVSKRKETWSEENPDGRWKKFTYDEIIKRDKTNLDITWIKDESLADLDNLPEPDELAQDIIENLEEVLSIFKTLNV